MFQSLTHRNFRLFFFGQMISLIGTWMQSVAQAWLIYRLTHSAMLLGLTGFASQIPSIVFSPIAGVLADRVDRRRVLIGTQVAAMVLAFVLAALTWSEAVEIWQIIALSALLGVVNSFDIPARQSFVVEMVGKEDLGNAIALNSSMFNGARIVGPAVAGVLVAAAGEGWCFFINGVSYVAVIASLLAMRFPPRQAVHHSSSAWEHLLEGFRFVRGHGPIKTLLILMAMVSLMGLPYATLMPLFADEILHGGSSGLGILMGMSGAGALLGALTLTLRSDRSDLPRWIFRGTVGFSLSLIVFAYSRVFWLSALLLVPAGYGMMVQMASSNTLIQSMVPDRLRGRVMAVYSMMFLGMAPFGALFSGALAKPLGAPTTVALGAVACLGFSVWFKKALSSDSIAARIQADS